MSVHDYSIDDILSKLWNRKIAHDLVAELEAYTGERLARTQEMRQVLGHKAYQELLERLRLARGENRGTKALRAVAHAMRDYALERPALSAVLFVRLRATVRNGARPMTGYAIS
jgi:glutamine synthetase type III